MDLMKDRDAIQVAPSDSEPSPLLFNRELSWIEFNAKVLEEEFERIGFPFDAIHEIDFTQNAAELAEMVRQGGGHV